MWSSTRISPMTTPASIRTNTLSTNCSKLCSRNFRVFLRHLAEKKLKNITNWNVFKTLWTIWHLLWYQKSECYGQCLHWGYWKFSKQKSCSMSVKKVLKNSWKACNKSGIPRVMGSWPRASHCHCVKKFNLKISDYFHSCSCTLYKLGIKDYTVQIYPKPR